MAAEFPLVRPRTAIEQLRSTIIPSDVSDEDFIELTITVDDVGVNVRELNAYLALIDRTYGRLSSNGLQSYLQRERSQLRVSFRVGSLEIVIRDAIAHADSVLAVVVVRYLLKYLPATLKDVAAAYRDYEEGLMVRERRRQLREEIKQDQEFAKLDNRRKNEIIAFLDALYYRDRRLLPAAQRFASKYVRKITIKVVKQDKVEDDSLKQLGSGEE